MFDDAKIRNLFILPNFFLFLIKYLLFILLFGFCHYLFPWIGINLGKTFLDSFILNGEKVLGIILIILSLLYYIKLAEILHAGRIALLLVHEHRKL